MTTATLGLSAYSIQGAKPALKYGQLAVLPQSTSDKRTVGQVSLAGIPSGATVTSAVLRFTQGVAVSGSETLTVFRNTTAFTSAVTWNTRPSVDTGTGVTVVKSSPAAGTTWDFDLTTMVQGMVTGTFRNYGFTLAYGTGGMTVLGTPATSGRPVLVVSYYVKPATPSNLNPSGGSVSGAKPTLTFDTDDDVTNVQVQIDPAMSGSPAFTSSVIAATAGLVDLTATAYAGLSNGSSTYWRARQQTPAGWSDYSAWAQFTRTNKGTVTITTPATSSLDDVTPTVSWTFSGTQTAWRVILHGYPFNRTLADSGRTVGTATSWTAPQGFKYDGDIGNIEVRVYDNVDRETTPGDPTFASASLNVTVDLDAGVTPMSTLAVSQTGVSPAVTITGTRASIPDQVRVFVNGEQTAVYDGVDVFTGTNMSIRDMSAPMNVEATYRVAPVVGGKIAKGGPTFDYTPGCTGIWLFNNSDTSENVMISGFDDQDQDQPELAIEHMVISGGDDEGEVVRRRLIRALPQGTIDGVITDVRNLEGRDFEDTLKTWAGYDAGHIYRLFLGNHRHKCIIGNLKFSERKESNEQQYLLGVSLNWWMQK